MTMNATPENDFTVRRACRLLSIEPKACKIMKIKVKVVALPIAVGEQAVLCIYEIEG